MNHRIVGAGIHCGFALLTQSLSYILFCTTASALDSVGGQEGSEKEKRRGEVAIATQSNHQVKLQGGEN